MNNTNDKETPRTPQHPEKEHTKRGELLRLLHGSWPFILLAGIVVGLYFWMFAPKDYADLVPSESRAVVQLKPGALLAGGGSLGAFLSEQVGFRPEGLDETQDVYVFITPNGYFGVSAPVHDGRKLSEQILRLSQNNEATILDRSDQLSWAWLKRGWIIAWNSSAVLTLGPGTTQEQDKLRQLGSQLFKAGSSESFRNSEHAKLLENLDGDVRLFSHLDALPSPFSMLFRLDLPEKCSEHNTIIIASADVQKAKANGQALMLQGSITSEDDATKQLLAAASKPIAAPSKPFAPDAALLYMAAHSDGDKLLQLLRSDATVRTMLLSLDRAIPGDEIASKGGGDFFLTLMEMPKDADARFRLFVEQDSSVIYDEHTLVATPTFETSATSELATGKTAFFRLNVASLLKQPALQSDETAEILRNLLSGLKTITFAAEKDRTFKLTIE